MGHRELRSRRAARPRLLAALLALAPQAAKPEQGAVSPSGEWRLSFAPLEADGNGPTELVLKRGDEEVLRRELDMAVHEALVDDAGRVAGFGYSGKPEPRMPSVDLAKELRVFALAADGSTLVDEAQREQLPYPCGGLGKMAGGCFLQPDLGRFVVRVGDDDLNRGAEEWWAYDLASGAVAWRERPKLRLGVQPPLWSVLDARALPGTPLVLVQWYVSRHTGGREEGYEFQLVDPEWRVVWSRRATSEWTRTADRVALGGRAPLVESRAFEIPLDPRDRKRGRFEVRTDGEGWSVVEAARAK